MTTYVAIIEGQRVNLPEQVGPNDNMVKAALSPFFPDAANALITRETKGDTVEVKVVKKAGSKGTGPGDYLASCPGGRNPAYVLYNRLLQTELEAADPVALMALGNQVDTVLEQAETEKRKIIAVRDRLISAPAQPASFLVLGF